MTTLVRWNPSLNLFNEFDRLFDTSLRNRYQDGAGWALAVDVVENEDGYLVKASVPGVNPDDLEVTLEKNLLTIRGEIKADEDISKEQYHVRERRFGKFSRTVRFPVTVDASDIEASYENGVLTLNVPKAEEVKPKRITVNVD